MDVHTGLLMVMVYDFSLLSILIFSIQLHQRKFRHFLSLLCVLA